MLGVGTIAYHRGTFKLLEVTGTASALGVTVTGRDRYDCSGGLLDLMGGLQLSLTEPRPGKIAPHVGGGIGLGRLSGKLRATSYYGADPLTRVEVSGSDTSFSLHGVFAFRVYAGDGWGIRPEIGFIRYTTWGSNAFRAGIAILFGGSAQQAGWSAPRREPIWRLALAGEGRQCSPSRYRDAIANATDFFQSRLA